MKKRGKREGNQMKSSLLCGVSVVCVSQREMRLKVNIRCESGRKKKKKKLLCTLPLERPLSPSISCSYYRRKQQCHTKVKTQSVHRHGQHIDRKPRPLCGLISPRQALNVVCGETFLGSFCSLGLCVVYKINSFIPRQSSQHRDGFLT